MQVKIRRTIPPTAAPIPWLNFAHALAGIIAPGKYLHSLEESLRTYFGVKHVYLVSSGKSALVLILRGLATLSKKKNVLIPAYTCFSVPSSVIHAGMRVTLCDINPATFDFNYDTIHAVLGDDTLCVVATHLFGIPADVPRIQELCRTKNSYVVEDASQSLGGNLNGGKLGTIGDVGFFSLGRGKNITCGEGGIIITNSDEIAAAISREIDRITHVGVLKRIVELIKTGIMNVFIRPSLYWIPAGIPALHLGETVFYDDIQVAGLSGMHAGLLASWSDILERHARSRRINTAAYFDELGARLLSAENRQLPMLRMPFLARSPADAARIHEKASRSGLGVTRMYPSPINEIPELHNSIPGNYPGARRVADTLLMLPTHEYLTYRDIQCISAILRDADGECAEDRRPAGGGSC